MASSSSHGSHVRAIGPYALEHEVGSGPLGSLWSAHIDSGPWKGALVSIRRIDAKRLPSEVVDDLARAAVWAMEVKNDRLVAVSDILGDANELSVVGSRLEGISLRTLLRAAAANSQPIPEPVAARVALDIADQLTAIHSTTGDPRYIFGGLSPESVFVERDGWTHVIDIGVSAAASRTAEIGLHVERVSYFAPEQVSRRCDARTDVFVLGLVLWEMLAIRRVYRAQTIELLAEKVRAARIPRLNRLVRPGTRPVSDAVSDVIKRAVAKDPSERYPTPNAFADALAKAVQPSTHVQVALTLGLIKPSSSVKPAPSRRIPLPTGPRRQVDTLPYAADMTVIPSLDAIGAPRESEPPPVTSRDPSLEIDADWDDK